MGSGDTSLPDRSRTGSAGPVIPGTGMKIAPDGEMLAKGLLVFRGYWKNPDKTAETIRNGWLHTGDAGRIDDDGFAWITGRIKYVIITARART